MVLVTLQLGISKILKKLFFNLFGKITDFSVFLALESITESRVFKHYQTLKLLSDFWHMLGS